MSSLVLDIVFDLVVNQLGSTQMALDVLLGDGAAATQVLRVTEQLVHDSSELVSSAYREAAATGYQVVRLAELAVIGSENDGDAIDRRLIDVVDATAETTAHHSQLSIAVQ